MQYERPHIEESRPLEAVLTWGPKGSKGSKPKKPQNYS
jgi:hypothetical protein